jgi:hypothetical protein
MFQLASQPQSIGKVLDNAFKLFAGCFKSVAPLALIAALAAVLPAMFMQQSVTGDPASVSGTGMGMFFTIYLVGILISLMLYNALFYKVHSISRNEAVDYGQAVGVGLRKLFPVIGAVLLYILAVIVGSILLIVPGIILMLSLIFYMPLIVCDNQGPIAALKTSHRLVWGNWWRTMTVFMAPAFIYLVIYMAAGMVVGIMAGVSVSSGEADIVSSMNLYMNLLTIIVSIFGYPFFAALIVVQINDLKLRKSGADLDARIAA